jgi:hypothetical protein
VRGFHRLAHPLQVYGRNALLVFVGSGVLGRITGSLWQVTVGDKKVSAKDWFFREWLLPIGDPKVASLAFALLLGARLVCRAGRPCSGAALSGRCEGWEHSGTRHLPLGSAWSVTSLSSWGRWRSTTSGHLRRRDVGPTSTTASAGPPRWNDPQR